jgi:hypothetical protein
MVNDGNINDVLSNDLQRYEGKPYRLRVGGLMVTVYIYLDIKHPFNVL